MSTTLQLVDALQAALTILRAQVVGSVALPPFYTATPDRVVRPKPPLPALGPAGFRFTDPAFGSRLLRVTDGATGGGGGSSWRVPSNAQLAAWSADGTHFVVMGSGGGAQLFAFDPKTMTATPMPGTSPYSQTEPGFSRITADTLYTVGGPQTRTIRAYSLATHQTTDVIDLDTLGLTLDVPDRTYVGGVLAGTATPGAESLLAFFGGTAQDRHYLALWLPRATPSARQILNTQTLTINGVAIVAPGTAPFHLHSALMDLSGRYVLLGPTSGDILKGVPQIVIWDTTLGTLTPVTAAMHMGGHGICGYGVWVNQDQGAGGLAYDAMQWQIRSLAAPTVTTNLVNPVLTPPQVYAADHTSWSHARPEVLLPVVSSTYRYGAGVTAATAPPWRAWDDEILAIDTASPPGLVHRFCHHRTDLRDERDPTQPYYWAEPNINVSPDGQWCLFTSNWEKSLGLDPTDPPNHRQDVFLVALT